MLFWAYLLGRLMTFAAALNVALWRRREADPATPPRVLVAMPIVGDLIGAVWAALAGHTRREPPTGVDPEPERRGGP